MHIKHDSVIYNDILFISKEGSMFNRSKKVQKQFDWPLLLVTLALCIIGIIILNSASSRPKEIITQIIASALGFIIVIILQFVDMDALKRMGIPLYILSLLLLLATLFFGGGQEEWGANSWLTLGPISFQPSEFCKIFLILALAGLLEKKQATLNKPLVLLFIGIFCLIPLYMINKQPDFGTAAVILFVFGLMVFYSGLHWGYIICAIALALIAIPYIYTRLSPGQQDRILNFLDPSRDPMASNYQILQGIIAIGSGQFSGQGYKQGLQTQNGFIPEQETDYIFAVYSEEWGFIGGLVLIILYFIYLIRLMIIAKNAKDLYGSLVCVGVCAMVFIHIFENIGMTIGLMPVTGIPLPYMSYGGTFQLINLVGLGLALSVGTQRKPLDFRASP